MTMVEKVAKALFHEQVGGADGKAWTLTTEDARSTYRARARAAIEAMREVPPDMFLRAEKAGISFATQSRVWPAMIDAALAEKT